MIFSFLGGIVLGGIFFGGLYYTTKMLPKVNKPALFMFLSISIRMTILLVGLYFIFNGEILRLITGIAGVFSAKYIIVNMVERRIV